MNLDFLVPGFSKCGTTSLCSLLAAHPDIFIPAAKEPCFFAYNFHRGWGWYERSFRHAREHQVCGEGSTFYSTEEYAEITCQRALERFPNLRFIFIARHPLHRLESSFREMHNSGYKYGVQADPSIERTLRNLPNMVADTLYWQRIKTFRQHVADARIHVLYLEDMRRHPERELRRCFKFLGVDSQVDIRDVGRRLNPGSQKFYDTRAYRRIQNSPWMRPFWDRLPQTIRDRVVRVLRLRRPFSGNFEWPDHTLEWLLPIINEDARQFLLWSGKSEGYWKYPRLQVPAPATTKSTPV